MISLDFSISRKAVEFIYEQRVSESQYSLIQFTQREIVTRVVGVSLSILIIADFGIHCIGVGEKTFYVLYKGILNQKPIDFSLPIKHLKCLKLFLCTFRTASIFGLILPCNPMFFYQEVICCSIGSVRGLLLSRNTEHFTDKFAMASKDFMNYILSLAKKLDAEQKENMQDTIELLENALKIYEDFEKLQKVYVEEESTEIDFCQWLDTTYHSNSKTFFENILKDVTTRFLALGLSIFSAKELIFEFIYFFINITADFIFTDLSIKDLMERGKRNLSIARNMGLLIFGMIFSSAVGVFSPPLGCKLADVRNSFYSKENFSVKDVQKNVLNLISNLEVGKSILIPIEHQNIDDEDESGHLVTLLVNKCDKDGYSVSLINKGLNCQWSHFLATEQHQEESNEDLEEPSEDFEKDLEAIEVYFASLMDGYGVVNLTSKVTQLKDLEPDLNRLLKTVTLSKKELQKKVEKTGKGKKFSTINKAINFYVLGSILSLFVGNKDENESNMVEDPLEYLYCNLQKTGDCAKSSLLGALHYHSWKKNGDSKAYKIFLNNIKKKALEEDGHLLNISLASPLTNEKPSVAVKKQVEKATAKLNPDERIKFIEICSRNIMLYARQMV